MYRPNIARRLLCAAIPYIASTHQNTIEFPLNCNGGISSRRANHATSGKKTSPVTVTCVNHPLHTFTRTEHQSQHKSSLTTNPMPSPLQCKAPQHSTEAFKVRNQPIEIKYRRYGQQPAHQALTRPAYDLLQFRLLSLKPTR
ncbi:conserved hypothetical protein [Xylella fastidiosa Temecula1]|uniref:Uncharacterized protein n=1 Tax=Xylella fastidiosa (strain Temecula1 / ATCC 700964) TaxID=183190 RepID=Q87E38_XYLFT|nr:conserved hypothetical protein [Xylella fastidiosa Temecula1]